MNNTFTNNYYIFIVIKEQKSDITIAMATDRDDALQYLLSKLQSEDGWSCANLAWNEDRLTVITDQFSSFDGAVKSKLLLSFLAMSPRVIQTCRDEMLKLLRLARRYAS